MSAMVTLETLINNPILAGIGTAGALTWLGYQVRSIPRMMVSLFARAFVSEMVVNDRDTAFQWIETWLSKHPYASRSHRVRLTSRDGNGISTPGSNESAEWVFSPGSGSHLIRWRGRWILIERNETESGPNAKAQIVETFRLKTLGRSQATLRSLAIDARSAMDASNQVRIRVWRDCYWASIRGKEPRPIDTIVLEEGQRERILQDMQWYLDARDWYLARGIPYRRGYLFSGPPGTGKTSLVLALAGVLKKQVCIINIGSIRNDDSLISSIIEAPHNAMLVFEDIDCIGVASDRKRDDGGAPNGASQDGVTKAGLLNALDGVATPDGRIFVMTTNHPERLDEALVRPGRADIHERFDLLSTTQQVVMARNFYGVCSFLPLPHRVSPCAMQAAFMLHPDDADAARDYLARRSGDAIHLAVSNDASAAG